MHRSNSLRMTTIGFAVLAAIAVQGTAAGAHSFNPAPPGEQPQHAWNPASSTHTNPWNSNTEAAAGEHSVNPTPSTTNNSWSPPVESDSAEHSGC